MDLFLNANQAARLREFERTTRLPGQGLILNPTYEVTVTNENGHPHYISIRPVVSPNDVDESVLPYYIAYLFRREIFDRIKRVRPFLSDQYIRENVSGFISATTNESRYVSKRFNNLNALRANTVLGLLNEIVQSQSDLTIGQVIFAVNIDPTFFRSGAGLQAPKFWNKIRKFQFPWQNFEDEKGPIACAAISLCMAMDDVDAKVQYYANALKTEQLKKDARVLMDELGWGVNVGIVRFKDFVEKYPEWRVTILREHGTDFSDFTFTGKDFVPDFDGEVKRFIYVYYDMENNHYVPASAPRGLFARIRKNTSLKFCDSCVVFFTPYQGHVCDTVNNPQKRPKLACIKCGLYHEPGTGGCSLANCKNCLAVFKKRRGIGYYPHRCLLCYFPRDDETKFNTGDNDGRNPSLWVYDLESRVSTTRTSYFVKAADMDEDGFYNGEVQLDVTYIDEQIPNLVIARNVFTGFVKKYFGDDCIKRFCDYLSLHNHGNSICLAHNGSGYDTRLVFNDLVVNHPDLKLNPLMSGSKFIQLQVGKKLLFRDSYLHICGSLKKLAIDFLGPGVLEKGYFPHKFNKLENYDYVGDIPDKHYFDFSTFKDENDWNLFNEWYDSFKGEWNFKTELYKYCQNDVDILSEIVSLYNDILIEIYDMSPWLSMTAASFGHKISLKHVTMNRELDVKHESYIHEVEERACKTDWGVLFMPEYYMVRKALRGGRTDIRKLYTKLTQEEIDRGCKIVYQDLCSQYPYQQVVHDFPVGLPNIFAYDERFLPCKIHSYSTAAPCDCPRSVRKISNYININCQNTSPPTKEEILNDPKFFGYICASVKPPKDMYHPILIHYDEDEMKCKAGCEDIIQGYFTSIEFVKALENGYEIIEIFRYDRYARKPSFWAETIKPLFLGKMMNSRPAPVGQELEQLLNDYDQFDMRDMIVASLDKWGKNPAKKSTFKIMMNSGWGKHAQRPVLQRNLICNYRTNENAGLAFFMNLSENKYTYDATVPLAEDIFMYRYKEDGDKVAISLENSYLPAACFVPAYGRLQLWEELNKLGERVLMNDTDSIVYIYDPDKYNIPASSVWGGWEIEHDSIVEFVGLGPKTYAFKKADGEIVVKNKGIRMSRATRNLINFERMKEMVLDGLASGLKQTTSVPQTLFSYVPAKNIKTLTIIKELGFSIKEQKGVVSSDGKIYPIGYDESLFEKHPMLN